MRKTLGIAWIVLLATACTTTAESRQWAQDAIARLAAYQENRKAAIDDLNADYRATYSALLRKYREVSLDRLELQRRADARAMADELSASWQKNGGLTPILTELDATRTRQLEAIRDRVRALTAVRIQYAKSYNDLTLELKKIEDAQAKLTHLAQEEDTRRATLFLLRDLAIAYGSVRSASSANEDRAAEAALLPQENP